MESPTPSLHVVAIFRAAPGRRDELREVLLSLVGPTRQEAGCIRYTLTEETGPDDRFVFVEEWTSEAALDEHLLTPHIARLKERLPGLMSTDLELLRLTPVIGP